MAKESRRAKIYSVGLRSELLRDKVTEIEFEGKTVADLLRSVRTGSKSLHGEVVAQDGTFSHGYTIALNGELIRCDELSTRELPDSSEVVVIHLMQIPAGG